MRLRANVPQGIENVKRTLKVIELGKGSVLQVDHAVGCGGLLPEMHYGLRPKALKASVDEVRVAQVPFIEVDLLAEHILERLQAFAHSPYRSGAPTSDLLDPLPPEEQARPVNLVSTVCQIQRKGPSDVPFYTDNRYWYPYIV